MKKLFQLISKNCFRFQPKLPVVFKTFNQPLPIITISRERGSGGKVIANMIVKKLGQPWRIYHKEIINEIAKETHLEKELINEVDEKRYRLVNKVIADTLGKNYLTLNSYYKHLLKILSTIGNRGYAVIVGRGVNFLSPSALKVRIICSMDQRIKWMMEYEKMTKKQAITDIEESDKNREEFTKTLFKHNVRKAHHYDLVIRTGKDMDLEDAANIIVSLAKKRFKI